MEKVYAIFGATGGIGSALIKRLSETQSIIYLLGRNEDKLKKLSKEVSQPYIVVDATDENLVALALKKIVEKERVQESGHCKFAPFHILKTLLLNQGNL